MSKNSETVNATGYNAVAGEWDEVRSGRVVDHCIEEFCALLPEHAHILDVGCGTGKPIARYCCDRGFQVTGIDISGKMLEIAGENVPEASLHHVGLLDFQTEERFDGVIGFDSVFHIEHEKQRLIYPKVNSLLRKGGVFIFTAGLTDEFVVDEMFGHEFYYAGLNKTDLRKILAENGFEILRFEEHYEHPTTGNRDLLVVVRKISY